MSHPAAAIASKVAASKWTWIILILVLVLLFGRGPIRRLMARLRRVDRGNYDTRLTQDNPRTAFLETLAEDLYAAIDGLPAWSDKRPALFERALTINDTELRYLAQYYRQISGGNSLRTDVNGEWSVIGDSRQRLVARLLKLNL